MPSFSPARAQRPPAHTAAAPHRWRGACGTAWWPPAARRGRPTTRPAPWPAGSPAAAAAMSEGEQAVRINLQATVQEGAGRLVQRAEGSRRPAPVSSAAAPIRLSAPTHLLRAARPAPRGLQIARGHERGEVALLLQVLIAPVLAQLHNVVLALPPRLIQIDACGSGRRVEPAGRGRSWRKEPPINSPTGCCRWRREGRRAQLPALPLARTLLDAPALRGALAVCTRTHPCGLGARGQRSNKRGAWATVAEPNPQRRGSVSIRVVWRSLGYGTQARLQTATPHKLK